MSLVGALHLGRTGLAVTQSALEVVGNNLANAATPGYTRQSASLAPSTGINMGSGNVFGTGVKLKEIIRHVDEALNARVRSATSDQHASLARQEILTQIESIQGELTDAGLSAKLTEFFNSWSELANNPSDNSLRSLVVSQGGNLSQFLRSVRDELVDLRTQIDRSINAAGQSANDLVDKIAALNQQIVVNEAGQGGANALRDERDMLLSELAEFVDITTIEQSAGAVDVFVASTPIVLGTSSRGLEVETISENNTLVTNLKVKQDQAIINPGSGRLGQLLTSRENDVNAAIDTLDQFTKDFIFEVNRLHSSGQADHGFDTVSSFDFVDDPAVALNLTAAGLEHTPKNGTFDIHLRQKSTNELVSTRIEVDLDGIGADTTLNDLATSISAVANITATVGVDGRITLTADSADFEFTFSDDHSGVLAALGINTFFTGSDATNIDMNQVLTNDPTLLATGQGHISGDNRTALLIADLGDAQGDSFNGLTFREFWGRHIEDYAIRTGQTNDSVKSTAVIVEGLETQRQSKSGVNLDEEAINLITFEQAYQGSARFLSVVNELMDTMLGLVR